MGFLTAKDVVIEAIGSIGENPTPEQQETKRVLQSTLLKMIDNDAKEAKGNQI